MVIPILGDMIPEKRLQKLWLGMRIRSDGLDDWKWN